MSDLHTTVVAELDRLESLYGGDRKDGRHAALMALVEPHVGRDDWPEVCCVDECTIPCPTLLTVAEALGIEVSDGG